MKFKEIEISKIKAKDNVRDDITKESIAELVQSINEKGIIQPLVVRVTKEGYDLVAGFRRLMSAKQLKHETVPCIIREIVSDDDRKQVQLIENIQREDLNPMEEAAVLNELTKVHNYEDLAMMIGKNVKFIQDRIKILSLPALVTDALKQKKLSIGHAIVISRLMNKKTQIELTREILSNKFSVARAEHCLEQYSQCLSHSAFDKKDCQNCVNNGTNIKDFFDKDSGLKGQCMDAKCFDSRVKNLIAKRKEHWKVKKIPTMTRNQYWAKGESGKWHEIDDYEMKEAGKDLIHEEMNKAENVAIVIQDSGHEKLLMKKAIWKALTTKKKKKDSGKKSDSSEVEARKQREDSKQVGRVDATKRRFLIEKLEKKSTCQQLAAIVLEILFMSEDGISESISEFFVKQNLLKKKSANFETRYKMPEILQGVKEGPISNEQFQVAIRAIKNHGTEYLETMGKQINIDMSQFRMDEDYLSKHTRSTLMTLVKEFKLKVPEKFETFSKSEKMKWILDQKIDKAPKEVLK